MSNITLKEIIIRAVNIPLNRPIVAHLGKFESWPLLCLDVVTHEGVIGRSYISPYSKDYLLSISSCIKMLSKSYIDKNIEPYSFYEYSMKSLSLLGFKGIGLYALAALDIAFWDAFTKSANKPLADYLGGSIKKKLKAYNSNGLWLIEIDKLAKEAEYLRNEGDFKALKLRLGRATYKKDMEAFKEVQRGAGDDVIIMSDYNQCFTTKDALRRCYELDELGFYWFEEPIQFNLIDDLVKICGNIKTPITIGENFHGPKDVLDALTKNACDMIMPDIMRIGGISGWLKASAIADMFNIEVSTHLYPEVSAHLMCITPTSEWLEWVDWGNPILKDTYQVVNGNIIIPNKPGVGIEWNENAITKYYIPIE